MMVVVCVVVGVLVTVVVAVVVALVVGVDSWQDWKVPSSELSRALLNSSAFDPQSAVTFKYPPIAHSNDDS